MDTHVVSADQLDRVPVRNDTHPALRVLLDDPIDLADDPRLNLTKRLAIRETCCRRPALDLGPQLRSSKDLQRAVGPLPILDLAEILARSDGQIVPSRDR